MPGAVVLAGVTLDAELRLGQNRALAEAREDGHTHTLARKPASRGAPSVLRGSRCRPYHLRRRIPTKTSIRTLLALYPSAKDLRSAPVNPHLRPSFFSFGCDVSDIGRFSNVIPGTTFSSPLKKRRVGCKSGSIIDHVRNI